MLFVCRYLPITVAGASIRVLRYVQKLLYLALILSEFVEECKAVFIGVLSNENWFVRQENI